MASWLGADLPDGTPPDLFDLAPPPFSVSTGVTQAGGLALRFPLEDDLALRCGATRSKLRAVITLLRPRHLWLTLPLHPFGGWGRFESSRGKDSSPGSGCGRRHLDFLLDLGRLQSLSGGTFSVLHHLTSTAWREPAAVALLASVPRARLLLGPTPGLPFCLKTILPSLLPPLRPISPRPSPRPCSPRRVSRPGPACGEPVTLPFASPLGTPPGRTWGGGGGGGFAALLAQQKRCLWASRATAGPSSKANGGSGGRLPRFFPRRGFYEGKLCRGGPTGEQTPGGRRRMEGGAEDHSTALGPDTRGQDFTATFSKDWFTQLSWRGPGTWPFGESPQKQIWKRPKGCKAPPVLA